MPIVEAPDGKIIEFPDTMDTGSINAEMAKAYPVQEEKPAPKEYNPTEGMSGTEKVLAGIGKGMVDIGRGIKQRRLEIGERLGIVSEEDVKKWQQEVEETRRLDQPLMETTAGKVGSFIGQAVPTAIVPGGVAGKLGTRMLTSAAAGAGIGAVQPTTSGESALTNVGLGAATGAGTTAALGAAGKVINAFRGKTSKPFGISKTLGEETGSPIQQKAETWMENIPIVGIKSFREKQQKEASGAARSWMADYIADPNNPTVQGGRNYASGLFKDLDNTVKGISTQEIKPSETRPIAKHFLDRFPDIFKKFQDTKRESLLRNIVYDTKDVVTTSPILNSKGQVMTTSTPKTMTFEEAWELRSGIGDLISQAKKQLASGGIDRTTLGQMNRLYAAVNNDIDRWAASIKRPDISESIKTANNAYKQYVVKFDAIQRVMDRKNVWDAEGFFSPQKFSTGLREIISKNKYYGKFTNDEIDTMSGLANILQTVKRAGQYKENPPTGNRWGALGALTGLEGASYLAGGAIASAKTAGATIGIGLLGKFLTTTEPGKRLAMAASKVNATSPMMKIIIDNAYNQLPKFAEIQAIGGINENQ